MSFDNVGDVERLLRSPDVSVRDLHTIWEQRLPVPDASERKKPDEPSNASRQIAWLQQDVTLAPRFTTHALEQEEYLLAWDAATEILRLDPKDEGDRTALVQVRRDYATALTRLGLTRAASAELETCLAPDFRPALGQRVRVDILLQLGHILREEAYHASAKAERDRAGNGALEFYRRALAIDGTRLDVLHHIAAAAFVLGEAGSALRDEATAKARAVLDLVKQREADYEPSWETTWARAAALTVLGDVDAAARGYADLQKRAGATTTRLADARFWTQFLAQALDKPPDFFKSAFPPLQLIVFSGHLPDRPGDRVRFPPERIEAVRAALRKQLEIEDARVGLVSASAGADLLFIEALRARAGTVHLVLPWSQDEFRRTSVRPFDVAGTPFWEPLFDKAIADAATIREIGQVYEPSSDIGWEYMTEVTAGIALHTARASRLDIRPMVLWDERPGHGVGGTDSFYSFWNRQLAHAPIIINPLIQPSEQRPGPDIVYRRRCEGPILQQDVKSMLFADIVGYSKLTEKVVGEFVGSFLGRVSRLLATTAHPPCSVNTWGDAVTGVFDFTRDAGLFALELAELVEENRGEWLKKGLYHTTADGAEHPLSIRIGLHAGPVVVHYDPVVRRLGFTGSHVTRAARIEPVTKPGQVFASEEFAALAELGSEIERRARGSTPGVDPGEDNGFVCQYAGTKQLAKGYPGRYRIYRVLRKRLLAIEDLARAAHEDYCAQARARGETEATNTSLRPWERLSDDLQQANRAAVEDIPNKLAMLGFELAPSHGLHPSDITITDADVERLAIREHQRWMDERMRSDWRYAPVRDNARKLHPLLVPWEKLSDVDKEKDRDTIRNLPGLVERAGFRVRRLK